MPTAKASPSLSTAKARRAACENDLAATVQNAASDHRFIYVQRRLHCGGAKTGFTARALKKVLRKAPGLLGRKLTPSDLDIYAAKCVSFKGGPLIY